MNEKEKRLAALCRKHGFKGALLRRRANISWLTDGADVHIDGTHTHGCAKLLWTPRKKIAYCSNIEVPRMAEEEFPGWEVRGFNWWEPEPPLEGRYLTDMPVDLVAPIRGTLTTLEIDRARELGSTLGAEVARVLKRAKPGMTEHEIAGDLAGRLRREGVFAAVLLVAADRRIDRYRHPIPTSNRVGKKLMVACCPRKWGLTVAITRIVHFGRLPDDLARRHDAVCRVDEALHAATAPGVPWSMALQAGIDAYAETGFPDEWTRHHQGGPTGYEGRDFKATPAEHRPIADDQPVGWNPSIEGTKSEDTILSTTREVLTPTPGWPMNGNRPDILVRR